LLLAVLFAEHLYMLVQLVVRGVVQKLDSPGLQKERSERYAIRKRLLEKMVEWDVSAAETHGPGVTSGEKITRTALEEEARKLSVVGEGRPEQLFWQRQRGADETIQVGRALIAETAANKTEGKY
jgi:anoctamin-10